MSFRADRARRSRDTDGRGERRDDRARDRGGERSGPGSGPRPRSLRLLTPARAGGLLGMLAAGLLLRLVLSSAVFAVERVDQPDLRWTGRDAVLAMIDVPPGTNIFGIEVAPIEARLAAIPGIASAHVSVALPGSLVVSIVEREAILAWRVGGTDYLVDRAGALFATSDPAAAAAASLPVVVDDRVASPLTLAVGVSLDPVDLDVSTRLAALTPADIGSTASHLVVQINDTDGYVIGTEPATWSAVFGFYSPSLRATDLIPGQVQLLRSLLATRESTVDRIILADARNGTYTLKPTPKPTKKP